MRVQYEGAVYHLMSRGDRREVIFQDEQDRQMFIETLGQCCGRTGWQVHALCLMPNHFHLVVETPQANLVAGTAGESGGACRADRAGRTAQGEVDGSAAGVQSERASGEGAASVAAASGDDGDV